MITDALIFILAPLMALVLGLVQQIANLSFLAPVIDGIGIAFTYFFHLMVMLSPIVPYQVQLNCLNVIFGYYVLLFTFRLVSWVMRKIPALGIS